MRSSTFQRGRIHGKAQSDRRRVVIPRPFAILMPLDYYMIVLLWVCIYHAYVPLCIVFARVQQPLRCS